MTCQRRSRGRFATRAAFSLLAAAAPAAAGGWLAAAEVTISLVAIDRDAAPLAERQSAWVSPFGGWVVATWPFGGSVGSRPLFPFATGDQQRLSKALDNPAAGDDEEADALARELEAEVAKDDAPRRAVDPRDFQLERPASITLSLGEGRHVIEPFGIAFTVTEGGGLASDDARCRIDKQRRRIDVPCAAVVFKTFHDGASLPAALAVSCGGTSLLGGLDAMLAEVEKRQVQAAPTKPTAIRRLTLFLPASAPGREYAVNGVTFTVEASGRVGLADSPQGRLAVGREIRLALDRAPSADEKPAAKPPAADPRRPVRLESPAPPGGPAFVIDAPPLVSPPGEEWSCRITPAAAGGEANQPKPAIPSEFVARLESLGGGASGGEIRLRAKDGVHTSVLHKQPGLWQIVAAGDSPLAGRALGLVWIGAEPPRAAVSIFTPANRGLVRRGDKVDLLWAARPADRLPADAPLILCGPGIEKPLGTLANQSLRLDTAGLAPGNYEITTRAEGLACYPLRLRVCQREPASDYEIFSATYGVAGPCAKSPVTGYYGSLPTSPGLAPLLAETDASLDAALAAYCDDPCGPAVEKFIRPAAADQAIMALAGQGMRMVAAYPTIFHQEDWNPKHTLAEDLAQMRRRLALFVQPQADLAGFGGVTMGWYAALDGFWEDSPCLDGHQARRNAAAKERVEAEARRAADEAGGVSAEAREAIARFAGLRAASSILPEAWAEYLADVHALAPGLTAHNAIPSWWLGGGSSYAPYAYRTLTDRNAVDYSDYGLTAWGNFRVPAWMAMGNRDGQKLRCDFMANQMHNRIVTSFAATGRGLDGFAMPCDGDCPQGEDESLRRIFERFGGFFSALEPLADVAVYNSDTNPHNVVLHDLARLRRPAMLVGAEDVLAGALAGYRVLVLVHAPAALPPGVLEAFTKFEKAGGIILKDRTTAKVLPGRDLGFGYDKDQVHPVWGLAYANGEDEFAHLWKNFKQTREPFLVAAFKDIPPAPVTTSDHDAVISPLAGRETICCFVVNQTLAPLELAGRWRQFFVLPKRNDLLVEEGWHVRDLLAGRPAAVEKTPTGWKTPLDFTRMEGTIYLLTKREPKTMSIRTVRTGPLRLRLTGWLADAAGKPLADPLPFEVTLRGPGDAVLFRGFAALSPERSLDVPVPAASAREPLRLVVRDLVIGATAEQAIEPADAAALAAPTAAEWIGGQPAVAGFLSRERPGPVTILLDERQGDLKPAAERLAAVVGTRGREARVVEWDPADVRPLPLRWVPTASDEAVVAGLAGGRGFAGRVGLGGVAETDPKTGRTVRLVFDDPKCGYAEYGPRLRHDADIVLFGTPQTSLAVAGIAPHLRRLPSANHPLRGGFFVHHLSAPFRAGFDGLYLACHDPAGAEAAVKAIAGLEPSADAPAAIASAGAEPVTTAGGKPQPLDDMISGRFGRPVLDIAFAPGGGRVFAATSGLGEQLFALAPDGKVTDHRAVHHVRGGSGYQRPAAPLVAIDADTVELGIGDGRYRYSLGAGFVGRSVPPAPGFSGKKVVEAGASTVLDDAPHGRTYLGGRRRVHAVAPEGGVKWNYDDEAGPLSAAQLKYPRSFFPRAVSGDGKVLLVAGFGSEELVFSAKPANETVLGLDTATGKVLWRKQMLLNAGSVVPLDAAFVVVDDAGRAHVLRAGDGAESGSMRPIKGTARLLSVPGRSELLVIENDAFDREGPAARVFLRPLDGGADRAIPVSGRVTDAAMLPDGRSLVLVTARGETLRVAVEDGRVEWRAATPSGGIVRLAPAAAVAWIGGRDGVIHRLDAATGGSLGTVDLNPFNVTTPDDFVRQMAAVGDVPVASGAPALPPVPLEPSYRKQLDPARVPLGKNLLPEKEKPLVADAAITLRVAAGETYLVEVVASAAEPARLTPRTRLEIAVTGKRPTANLPFVARLPLAATPARRRVAFRADEAGEVVLRVRAVEPGEGKAAGFKDAVASDAGLVIAEPFVGSLGFQGPNLLLEGGPQGKRDAAGAFVCAVNPWTGGSSLVRAAAYPCPKSALLMVNGRLVGDDTAWGPAVTGADVDSASGVVRFKKPRTLTAIAVYEDPSGPVVTPTGVAERAASRYGVFVRRPGQRDLVPIGHVVDNTNLVNVFLCPPEPIEEIHWIWAGRADMSRTDGPVRMAEIEAYGEELEDLLEDPTDDPL